MSVHLTCRVDEQLAEILGAHAKNLGQSRSDFLRHLIERQLTEIRESAALSEQISALTERVVLNEEKTRRSFSLIAQQLAKVLKEDQQKVRELVQKVWTGEGE